MSPSYGKFVWFELMTTDTAAATEFYCSAIGWRARDSGMPDQQYTILSAGETMVAGLMPIPQAARDAGARPGWIGYIAVDNVDEAAARVQAAAGGLHRPAEDIPGVGRFAIVSDPQGAIFTLFTGMDASQSPSDAGATPGRIGWHELRASNQEAAFTFYAEQFGWTKGDAIDMGPMGIYQLFGIRGTMIGGMMTLSDSAVPPSWLYYFNVDGADAAITRVKGAGGQVVNGPHQVPGGSWIAHCIDPQGAVFAVVAPAR